VKPHSLCTRASFVGAEGVKKGKATKAVQGWKQSIGSDPHQYAVSTLLAHVVGQASLALLQCTLATREVTLATREVTHLQITSERSVPLKRASTMLWLPSCCSPWTTSGKPCLMGSASSGPVAVAEVAWSAGCCF
jgi:hypothetical protein